MHVLSFFHLYGFIIGVACLASLFLIQKKAKINNVVISDWLAFIVLVGGIAGARLWHVLTDYYLYQANLLKIFYIWNGGLSILGGIAGGLVALYTYSFYTKQSLKKIADICVFGIPFGQAIGRLGNYVNQELYGLPTTLPWKITIDPDSRLIGYQNVEHYHPLFLYEIILTTSFGAWIWLFDRYAAHTNNQQGTTKSVLIGAGWYTYLYLFYYSVGRFFLDFIRIDKTLYSSVIGVNQLILLVIAVYSGIQLKKMYAKNQKK